MNFFIDNLGMIKFLISILLKTSFIFIVTGLILYFLRNNSAIYRTITQKISICAILCLPFYDYLLAHWKMTSSFIATIPLHNTFEIQNINTNINSSISYSASNIFMSIWFLGVIFLLLRNLFGWYLSYKIVLSSNQIENHEINVIAKQIENKLQIRKPIKYAYSYKISSPIVIGWCTPYIILPTDTLNWANKKLQMILIHETAHIKRNDIFWFFISSLLLATYWINPLAWIMKNKFLQDSEKVCDDFVILNGFQPQSYAKSLLSIVKNIKQNRMTEFAGMHLANMSQLEDRFMAIIQNKKRLVKVNNSLKRVMVLLTIIILLPLAGINLFAQSSDSELAILPDISGTKADIKEKDKEDYPNSDEFIQLTQLPEMIKSATPEYPKEAKKKGIEGDVWIKVLIDKTGNVIKAQLAKTSNSKLLDTSAIEAAYKSKFTPGIQDKKPVACWVSYKVTFKLDGEKSEKSK